MFGRVARPELEERVRVEHVVDDVADVVRRVGRAGTAAAAAGAVAVDRVVASATAADRRGGSTGGSRGRPRPRRDRGVARRRRRTSRRRSRVSCTRRAAERSVVDVDPGERPDDVGPADVGERVLGHHHVVGDARAAARGPTRTGPTTVSTVGTTPDASAQRLGDASPRVQRRDAFVDVGARRRRSCPTTGMPSSIGEARRRARCASPSGGPIAPRCLPPSRRNQLTVRPSISRERARSTASLRCPKTGVGGRRSVTPARRQHQRRVVAAEPERVREHRLAHRSRAGCPRTTSRPMSSPICSRFAVGGTTPSRSDEQRDRPPRPRRRRRSCARHALGRRDRRRVVAEDLADRLGLGGVVERRRRAVRVHVPDRRPASSPASSSASCMHAAAPAPPGDGAVMWYASALRP